MRLQSASESQYHQKLRRRASRGFQKRQGKEGEGAKAGGSGGGTIQMRVWTPPFRILSWRRGEL